MIYIIGILAIGLAYLSGSIPVGYLVARMYGVDVTASGSGRTGGTNVLRSAGVLAAGLTVMGDVLKGLIPVALIKLTLPVIALMLNNGVALDSFVNFIVALSMPAAVLGHNFSLFLGFRGGVGAGTAIGSVGGINFFVAIAAAVLAIIALALTRYASILSTTVAVSSLVLVIILAMLGHLPYTYILGAALNLAIIVNALRPNYARIRTGTERKVGKSKDTVTKISR